MTRIIQFLEALARDPRPVTEADYAAMAATVDDGAARDALLSRDPVAIAAAAGARGSVACFILTPDRDEPAREDSPADDGDEDEQPPATPDARAA